LKTKKSASFLCARLLVGDASARGRATNRRRRFVRAMPHLFDRRAFVRSISRSFGAYARTHERVAADYSSDRLFVRRTPRLLVRSVVRRRDHTFGRSARARVAGRTGRPSGDWYMPIGALHHDAYMVHGTAMCRDTVYRRTAMLLLSACNCYYYALRGFFFSRR